MPSHKKLFNFDPNTKTKYFSTPTQKPSQLRSLHWSKVKFDPHYKIKSILMRRRENQVDFDTYTKTKLISNTH